MQMLRDLSLSKRLPLLRDKLGHLNEVVCLPIRQLTFVALKKLYEALEYSD